MSDFVALPQLKYVLIVSRFLGFVHRLGIPCSMQVRLLHIISHEDGNGFSFRNACCVRNFEGMDKFVKLNNTDIKLLTPGIQIFSKNLGATSKFLAPGKWHEASCILRTHNYLAPQYKIWSSGRPGTRNLCTPDRLHRRKYLELAQHMLSAVWTVLGWQINIPNEVTKIRILLYLVKLVVYTMPQKYFTGNLSARLRPRRAFRAMCHFTYDVCLERLTN
jgi:hypothetical protein